MAKEVLAIPEEDLESVVYIIQKGLIETHNSPGVDIRVWNALYKWCNEMNDYTRRIKIGEK